MNVFRHLCPPISPLGTNNTLFFKSERARDVTAAGGARSTTPAEAILILTLPLRDVQ